MVELLELLILKEVFFLEYSEYVPKIPFEQRSKGVRCNPAPGPLRTPIYNFWPFSCTFVYAPYTNLQFLPVFLHLRVRYGGEPCCAVKLFFRAVPEKPISPLRTSFVTPRPAARPSRLLGPPLVLTDRAPFFACSQKRKGSPSRAPFFACNLR